MLTDERIAEQFSAHGGYVNFGSGTIASITTAGLLEFARAIEAECGKWQPIAEPPAKAGKYLVGQPSGVNLVGEARYQPRLGKWKFPSAQAGFTPTHWREMPAPPAAKEPQ